MLHQTVCFEEPSQRTIEKFVLKGNAVEIVKKIFHKEHSGAFNSTDILAFRGQKVGRRLSNTKEEMESRRGLLGKLGKAHCKTCMMYLREKRREMVHRQCRQKNSGTKRIQDRDRKNCEGELHINIDQIIWEMGAMVKLPAHFQLTTTTK